jgi:thioredoxin reductase (NADPH)
MAGFMIDTTLLEEVGVEIEPDMQIPHYNPDTMETNVPGIYIAGTLAGGSRWRVTHAIYNSHAHIAKIVKALTGRVPARLGSASARNGDVAREEL